MKIMMTGQEKQTKGVQLSVKTLPKALRTQALTALTSNLGLVGFVCYVLFCRFDLVGLVWYVWFGKFGLIGLVW